jgi:hypothetical protein
MLRPQAIRLTLAEIDALARATALCPPRRGCLAHLVFRRVLSWPSTRLLIA